MAAQNDFFTWQSLATFTGTTTATTVVVNGIGCVFPAFRYTAALGLFVSLALCVLIAVVDTQTGSIDIMRPFATYFIAIINGFFVFASAAGISAGGARVSNRVPEVPPNTPMNAPVPGPGQITANREPRFWRHWF